MRAELARMARYGVAGALATASHYVTMVALVWAWDGRELLATSAGFVVGAFVKYPLNYWMVFTSRERHRIAVPRFVASLAASFFANGALFALFRHLLDTHYLVPQVLTTAIIIVGNYLVARFWVFRHRVIHAPADGAATRSPGSPG
jgi:putative flippase GtrA